MLVDIHRSYLSQFCLEVVAKHSLLQIPNWLDGSRGRWHRCKKIAPAVMRKTKSRDPVNPVAIVISWEEARKPLYTWATWIFPVQDFHLLALLQFITCIALNIRSDRIDETRKDPPSVKAIFLKNKLWSFFVPFCWAFQLKKRYWMTACPIIHGFQIRILKICTCKLKIAFSMFSFGILRKPAAVW